jgi:hypothetical protein
METQKFSYSYESAEEATSISKHQWRKLARLGKIRVAKVGRRILIPASELRRVTAAGAVLKTEK